MKTQNQLNKSKTAKRRLRNKRRRKEQQLQRQEAKLNAAASSPTRNSTTAPKKTPSEQSNCPKKPAEQTQQQPKTAISDLLWKQTYENSTRWLCMQQMTVLRQRVELLQQENEVLRVQLERAQANGYAEVLEEYITSPSESEAEDEPEVDEGYLEFMAVTQRHREELRKARELEAAVESQYSCET